MRFNATDNGSRGKSGAAGAAGGTTREINSESLRGNGYVQIPPFSPIPLTRHAYVDTFPSGFPII
jgi:hypothetical protein